jgi:hypothetical protein
MWNEYAFVCSYDSYTKLLNKIWTLIDRSTDPEQPKSRHWMRLCLKLMSVMERSDKRMDLGVTDNCIRMESRSLLPLDHFHLNGGWLSNKQVISQPCMIILSICVTELRLIFNCVSSPSASASWAVRYSQHFPIESLYSYVLFTPCMLYTRPPFHSWHNSTQSSFCRPTALPSVDDIVSAKQRMMPPTLQSLVWR